MEKKLSMAISFASSKVIPTISIDELEFPTDSVQAKLVHAAQAGLFYLELTDEWKADIEAGKQFARNFPSGPDAFKENYDVGLPRAKGMFVPIGYAPLKGFQCESYRLITKEQWNTHFPHEIIALGDRMVALAVKVLHLILKSLRVREEIWEKLTGKIPNDENRCFTFNRYIAQFAGEGLPMHKDSGLITMLYNDKPGLEGRISNADVWSKIEPKENHFIVNLGRNLEVCFLNDHERNLVAIEHRVPRLEEDRISFAIFLDRDVNSHIYQTSGEECQPLASKVNPQEFMTFAEFQKSGLDELEKVGIKWKV